MALPLLRLSPSPHHLHRRLFIAAPSSPSPAPAAARPSPPLRRKLAPLAAAGAAEAAPAPVEAPPGPRTRLIAQNVPWTSTADDIRALFEKYGQVLDVELSMYNSSKNRGLAFVSMSSEEEATSALNSLNSYELDGRIIKVEFARTVKKSTPRPSAPSLPKYNVFVGNLSWRVRSRDLKEFFNGSGNIVSAEVMFHSNPRRSAGYGFVSYASKEEAEAAVSAFNEKELMGRPVRVSLGRVSENNTEAESPVGEQLQEASTG